MEDYMIMATSSKPGKKPILPLNNLNSFHTVLFNSSLLISNTELID